MNLPPNDPPSKPKTRTERTQDRDDHIVTLLKDNRPTRAIAQMKGLAFDYCRDLCRELILIHKIDWNPKEAAEAQKGKLPFGLTSESRVFRAALGTRVYALRDKHHFTEVGNSTGITNAAQARATQGQGTHDYQLSQIERIAKASDVSFRELVLSALLTKEEYDRVSKCLII